MSDSKTTIKTGLIVEQSGTLTPNAIELAPGGTADTKTVVQPTQTVDRTITLPDADTVLMGPATTDTLENKTIVVADNTVTVVAAGVIATELNSALAELAAGTGASDVALQAHIDDPTGAHAASAISVIPTGNLASTNVQAGLVELQGDIDTVQGAITTVQTNLDNHINDPTDAHDASAISVIPTGSLAATEVQSALVEIQTDVDTRATQAALTAHTGASSGVHGVTGNVVGTTDSQVITNKDIDGGTASNTSRLTVPKAAKSALDALTRKEATLVFASDTDKLYVDDGSVLKEVGSGSSANNGFISNPDGTLGTTGWTEGSYAAAALPSGTFTPSSGAGLFSISTTTTNPLTESGTSFILTKTSGASRQGRAVETSFALPLSYRAKVLQTKISYIIDTNPANIGILSSSSLIFYTAFSTDNGVTYSMYQPTQFQLDSRSTTTSALINGEVQSPIDATHMKLIAYVAETFTNAWSIKVNMQVVPNVYVYGSPITDFQSYTATLTNLGNATQALYYRREGDSVVIRGRVTIGSSLPTGNLTVSMPPGLAVDMSKGTSTFIGTVTASTGAFPIGTAGISGSSNLIIYNQATNNVWNASIPVTWAAGNYFEFENIKIPVLGWSSSVQMSDTADTRVVDFVGFKTTNESVTANTTNVAYTLIKDSHNAWNGTQYVVPVSGDYLVNLSIAGNAAFSALLYVNGTSVAEMSSSANGNTISGSQTVPNLKSGDLISVRSSQSITISGSNVLRLGISRVSGPQAIAATETVGALYTGNPPTGTLNGTFNLVTFGTKVKDSHSAYSSGTYTVPVSGQYDISAQVRLQGSYTTGSGYGIAIYINGVQSYIVPQQSAGTLTEAISQINIKSVPLLQGQLVTILTYSTATTPVYVASAAGNFFSISKSGNY